MQALEHGARGFAADQYITVKLLSQRLSRVSRGKLYSIVLVDGYFN